MRFAITSFVLALLLASSLRAASLPREAICDDAVAVIWVDARKADPAQLTATAKALLGENAKEVEDAIKQFAALRETFTKVGGESLAIVMRGPDERGRSPEPHFVVTFQNDADPEVLKDVLKLIGGNDIALMPAGRQSLIVARRLRLMPPQGTGGEAQQAINKALGQIGDSPAAIVFVPNAGLRDAYAKVMQQAADEGEGFSPGITRLYKLLDHVIASERGLLTCTLGEKAKLSLTIIAKDSDAAKAMAASVKPAAEAASNLNEIVGKSGRGDPGVMTLAAFLTAIQPKVNGREVTVELEGKSLEQLVGTMAKGFFLARDRAKEVILASNMRQVMIAIIAYSDDNNAKFPDTLEQLKPYLGDEKMFAEILRHPVTGESPAFKYIKPAATYRELRQPSATGVLFELKDGKVNPQGAVAFADSHIERTTPTPKPAPGDRKKDETKKE